MKPNKKTSDFTRCFWHDTSKIEDFYKNFTFLRLSSIIQEKGEINLPVYNIYMKQSFETGAPKGSGEERFRFREADETTGLAERAAEAQKRAAENAGKEREIDLTEEVNALGVHDAEELARITKEIKELPDGGFRETS